LGVTRAKTVAAASVGASLDIRLTDRISYRVVQPEVLLLEAGAPVLRPNFRVSTGVVFHFGR
jgi:hypothetical protein